MKFIQFLAAIFGKRKKTINNAADSYYNINAYKENAWIIYEHTLQSQHYPFYRTSNESKLFLGEVLSHLYDLKKEEIHSLTIVDNGQATCIEDSHLIWKWNILLPYKENQIEYRQQIDILNKLKYKSAEKSDLFPNQHQLFYNIIYRKGDNVGNLSDKSVFHCNGSIMIQTSDAARFKAQTTYIDVSVFNPDIINLKGKYNKINDERQPYHHFCIAYDFKNSIQARNEYEFVREAILKYDKNSAPFIRKHEWVLLQSVHIDISREYYWGKKAFSQSRYLDAILYFENIYKILQDKWFTKGLANFEVLLLTECSFLIGCCYNELTNYDKAYKYLEFASRTSLKKYRYKREFINCMVYSHNVLSIIYIDDFLHEFKQIKETDRTTEDTDFFCFLLRTKALILVQMNQYDEAEYILMRLLDKDPDNEDILHELAIIQRHKKQKSDC